MLSGHTLAPAHAPAPTAPPRMPLHGITHATPPGRPQEHTALRKTGMAKATPTPHLPASVPLEVARPGLERLAHLAHLRNIFTRASSTADWNPWLRLSPSNRSVVRVLSLVPDVLDSGLAQESLRTLLRRSRLAVMLHWRLLRRRPGWPALK